MKQILTILLLLICSTSFAQQHFSRGNATSIDSNRGTAVARYTMLQIDTAKSSTWSTNGGAANVAGKLYLYDGSKWASPTSGVSEAVLIDTSDAIHAWAWSTFSTGSSSVDSYLYATRAWRQKGIDSVNGTVAARVKYTDTADMLLNYAIEAQMLGYLGLKVDYADSGNAYFSVYGVDTAKQALRSEIALRELLSNKVNDFSSPNSTTYPTTTAVNSLVGSYKLKSDSFPTDGYTTRARLQKVADSINATIAALPTYTAGWGLTGGFVVDSYAVASRARLQKIGDSVAALIPSVSGYLQLSDTVNNVSTRSWRQKAVDSININVALKANIASPALTGTPTAPTASINNNSTQIATTEYVDRYHPVDTSISAAYTLTSRDFHRTIHCTNGSNIALTIPTGLGTTFVCVVLAEGAGTVTPTTSSTTFYYQPTSTTKIKSQGGATIRSWATANSYLIIGSLE